MVDSLSAWAQDSCMVNRTWQAIEDKAMHKQMSERDTAGIWLMIAVTLAGCIAWKMLSGF